MRGIFIACGALALFACGGDAGSDPDLDGGIPPIPGVDPSFGDNGVVTVGFDGGLAGLFRVARQPDGKLLAVGGTKESALIVRALADGSLDPEFSGDGIVQLPFGVPTSGVQVGFGCEVQPDGAIVIAAPILGTYGELTGDGLVARLASNGSLDASFGDGGYVLTGARSTATSLAIASDGALLVGGWGTVTRLLANGTVDPSFRGNMAALPSLGRILDLAILSDQSILALGNRSIARLTPSGDLDTSFGVEGFIQVPAMSSGDAVYSLDIDADGNILVGGNLAPSQGANALMWVGRYRPDGTPDDTFAGGAVGDPEGGGIAFGVGVDPAGRIVASGFTLLNGVPGRSARFDTNGNLDTSFGQGGAGANLNHVMFGNIAFEPDGAFTAVGAGLASLGGLGSGFAPVLVRTDASGRADGAFGQGGQLMFRAGGSFDRAQAVAAQPDGKILVGGWAFDAGGVGVVRLLEDGSLDPTFANSGVLLRSDNLYYVSSVAADPNGGVLISGLSSGRDFPGFAVERYLDSGQLDPNFGTAGVAGGTVMGGLEATSFAMTVAPNGTIYVVGQTYVDDTTLEYGLLALTSSGARVSGFGVSSAATSAFGSGRNIGTHVAVQPDGKIAVLGLAANRPTLVRFGADGVLDSAFGPIVLSDSASLLPLGLAVQTDGSIVAVAGDTLGTVQITRVTANGQLDPTFGTDGVVSETFGGNDYYGLYVSVGLAILPDGGIGLGLASGRDDGLVETGLLVRYRADGSPDTEFAPDGRQEIALGSGSTALHAMTLDSAGRLVTVGRTWTASGGSEFLAIRFQP